MKRRPSLTAAMAVVPLPTNGSSTSSPGSDIERTQCRTGLTACCQGSGSWSKSQRRMMDVLRPSVPWRSRRGGDAPLVHDER